MASPERSLHLVQMLQKHKDPLPSRSPTEKLSSDWASSPPVPLFLGTSRPSAGPALIPEQGREVKRNAGRCQGLWEGEHEWSGFGMTESLPGLSTAPSRHVLATNTSTGPSAHTHSSQSISTQPRNVPPPPGPYAMHTHNMQTHTQPLKPHPHKYTQHTQMHAHNTDTQTSSLSHITHPHTQSQSPTFFRPLVGQVERTPRGRSPVSPSNQAGLARQSHLRTATERYTALGTLRLEGTTKERKAQVGHLLA